MNKEIEELFTGDSEPWVQSLAPYQRKHINNLIHAGKSLEEIADTWLTANVQNTVPFGADTGKSLFLEKVWSELEKFLCDPNYYNIEREKIERNTNITHTYFVGLISAAISPTLGTSAVFLAPVIALLLASLGKISIRAWCQSLREKQNNNDSN